MPDTIGALSRKKAMLVERKRRIKEDADRQIREIEHEIDGVDKAIAVVNDAIKDILCPNCQGSGNIRHCDAAGDMEDITCPDCKGTGIKIHNGKRGKK